MQVNVASLLLFVANPKSEDKLFREFFAEANGKTLEDGMSYILKEKRNEKGL